MTRRLWTKQQESRKGRRRPKRHPSKHLRSIIWIDYPIAGPGYGRCIREFVKSARRREARDAWEREAAS